MRNKPESLFLVLVIVLSGWVVACQKLTAPAPAPTGVTGTMYLAFLAQWGQGAANRAVWSADERLIAVSSSMGVYLYDSTTREMVRWISTMGWESDLAFSLDNRLVGTVSEDGLRLWQVDSGDLERHLEGRSTAIRRVAFSPLDSTGEYLVAVGSQGGGVRLWNARTGVLIRSMPDVDSAVTALVFSSDGRWLAAGSESGAVYVWHMVDRGGAVLLTEHQDAITDLAFLSGGQVLMSGSWDGDVRLWNVGMCDRAWENCGTILSTWNSQIPQPVTSLDVAQTGNLAAVGMMDGSIQLWGKTCIADAVCWHLVDSIVGHSALVQSLAFSPDGAMLASVSLNSEALLWQVACPDQTAQDARCVLELIDSLGEHATFVNDIGWAQNQLVWGSEDGAMWLGDVSGPTVQVKQAHAGAVLGVALSADGQMAASAGSDGMIRLWHVSSQPTLDQEIKASTWPINDVALSPEGMWVAAVSCDKMARLWHTSGGELAWTLPHTDCVRSLAFSADGQTLITGANNGLVQLWSVADGLKLRVLKGHVGAVWSVAVSPSGDLIASGGEDKTVRLWSASRGQERQVFTRHTGRVTAIAISPDGRWLASAAQDRTILLWAVGGAATPVHTIKLSSAANGLTFSADGKILAAGLQGGVIQMWSLTTSP